MSAPGGVSRPWRCHVCKILVPATVTQKEHKRNEHKSCGRCTIKFAGAAALIAHQRVTGHCYCAPCGMHFAGMGQHLTHVRRAEKRPAAKETGEAASSAASAAVPRRADADGDEEMVLHSGDLHDMSRRTARDEERGPCLPSAHKCDRCGRAYLDEASVRFHCCDCDRVFRGDAGLDAHRATDRAHAAPAAALDPTMRHVCHVCQEPFRRRAELVRHVRADHAAAAEVACPLAPRSGCAARFASLVDLLAHFREWRCVSNMSLPEAHAACLADQSGDAGCVVATAPVDSREWAAELFAERLREAQAGVDGDFLGVLDGLQLLPAGPDRPVAPTAAIATVAPAGVAQIDQRPMDDDSDDGDGGGAKLNEAGRPSDLGAKPPATLPLEAAASWYR